MRSFLTFKAGFSLAMSLVLIYYFQLEMVEATAMVMVTAETEMEAQLHLSAEEAFVEVDLWTYSFYIPGQLLQMSNKVRKFCFCF